MRKILSVLLCFIILCCTVACGTGNAALSESAINPDTTQESSAEETLPYTLISEQERLRWKDKIVTALSAANPYEEIEPGILGAALMDLNLDNIPELIVVGAGGSMGNVCIIAYDLKNGEELCVLGDTPHYQDWDNVYFCYYRNDKGKYIIVNEGSLRDGLEWYMITSQLNGQFKFDTLFEEVKSSDGNIRYYCYGNEVEKAEFEQQKNQFKNDYKEIKETQIQIIYWNVIDAQNKNDAISAMADALINSEQEFIDFNK